MRAGLALLIMSTALAVGGCVMPSTSRGVLEPAAVAPPPSLDGDVARRPTIAAGPSRTGRAD
jgi:hypothetical protein